MGPFSGTVGEARLGNQVMWSTVAGFARVHPRGPLLKLTGTQCPAFRCPLRRR
jgi:hypothetical protein